MRGWKRYGDESGIFLDGVLAYCPVMWIAFRKLLIKTNMLAKNEVVA